jgi:uncharacterized protein (TIGR03435 family)
MHLLRHAIFILAAVVSLQGQAPTDTGPKPAFEVASIKRNVSGGDNASMRALPGGRVTVTNNSLFNLIRNAYQLQRYQMTGGPDWIDKDKWDIVAKAEGDPSPQQMLPMVGTLLIDRFKLVAHRETRDAPIYALVLAKSDGRLGPQLKPSSTDCQAWLAELRARGGAPSPAGSPVRCGIRFINGTVVGNAMRVADLARNLSGVAGRMVVDKTGLTGAYDFEMTFTPDRAPGDGLNTQQALSEGGSLFTALQEQLGLKLEAQRGSIEYFVIDSAERPTED